MRSQRVTFRLRPGRDDDLIAWLESMGEGERSYFIRQVLRRGLNSGRGRPVEQVMPVSPVAPDDLIEADEPAREVSREEAEERLNGLLDKIG